MHGIAVAILSVCMSDACIVTKRNNHLPIPQHYMKQGYLCLSIPTGVAGNCPFPPEIFAETDPLPSKTPTSTDFHL